MRTKTHISTVLGARIHPGLIFTVFFQIRLQQIADAGISLILLVAFSLVIAGASIYIVNERINGEKLQQKLCGVSFKTYWGVAFVWDYAVSYAAQHTKSKLRSYNLSDISFDFFYRRCTLLQCCWPLLSSKRSTFQLIQPRTICMASF